MEDTTFVIAGETGKRNTEYPEERRKESYQSIQKIKENLSVILWRR